MPIRHTFNTALEDEIYRHITMAREATMLTFFVCLAETGKNLLGSKLLSRRELEYSKANRKLKKLTSFGE